MNERRFTNHQRPRLSGYGNNDAHDTCRSEGSRCPSRNVDRLQDLPQFRTAWRTKAVIRYLDLPGYAGELRHIATTTVSVLGSTAYRDRPSPPSSSNRYER